MRDRQIARERPFDTRAILLSNVVAPVGSYFVAVGLLPLPGVLIPVLLAPVIATAIMQTGSPVFIGAAASSLAAILTVVTGIAWVWILWGDVSTTFLADFTYLSFYFAFPALVGGVIGSTVLGGVLGKLTVGAKALVTGDARVEFRF